MKNTIRYLVSSDKKIPLMREDLSANKLAQLPALNGSIGKTGILELLRGQKKNVKGFSIVEAPAPDRANKLGVEYIGTGRLRQRKPMQIFIKPLAGRGMSARQTAKVGTSDYSNFLTAIYSQCHASKTGTVEYDALRQASFPEWSRNMISVYTSRAKREGFIDTIRQSNKIGKGF